MVRITNGTDVYEVTQGAYDSIFKHQGYSIYDEAVPQAEQEAGEEHKDDVSDDDKFLAAVMEKPISQWNKNEVKKFAELKGIDISGTKNAGEAKEIIKNFLDEQEAGEE